MIIRLLLTREAVRFFEHIHENICIHPFIIILIILRKIKFCHYKCARKMAILTVTTIPILTLLLLLSLIEFHIAWRWFFEMSHATVCTYHRLRDWSAPPSIITATLLEAGSHPRCCCLLLAFTGSNPLAIATLHYHYSDERKAERRIILHPNCIRDLPSLAREETFCAIVNMS